MEAKGVFFWIDSKRRISTAGFLNYTQREVWEGRESTMFNVKFSGVTFRRQARTLSKIVAAATSTFPYLPILLSGCN
jgi:hypothetical protein